LYLQKLKEEKFDDFDVLLNPLINELFLQNEIGIEDEEQRQRIIFKLDHYVYILLSEDYTTKTNYSNSYYAI